MTLYIVHLNQYCACTYDSSNEFSIIKSSYYYAYEHNTIPISAGLNSEIFYLKIDLMKEESWLSFYNASQYKYNYSIILKDNVEFTYNDEQFQGKLIKDTFGIYKDQQILFQYSIVNQIPNSYKASLHGVLGQQFSFSETNQSFIHRLKDEGLIDHLSFSFSNRSKLFLGGIPNEEIKGSFKSYCNVIEHNDSWSCMLNNVLFHNGTGKQYPYQMNTPSIITFTTERNKNYVPQAFFDFMINDFFKERIESYDFRLFNLTNKTFVSSGEGCKNSGFIVMTIGDYSYTINLEEFWDCYEFGCDLNIFANPYGDYWIIGHNFYQYYYITFDYEEKRIEFYSVYGVEKVKDKGMMDNSRVIKGMMIWDMCILIIGVMIVMMGNMFKKKHKAFN